MVSTLPTGAFSRELAQQRIDRGNWHFDARLAQELKRLIGERSAFDFGAGIGQYCRALRCRGVDGIPGIAELSRGLVMEGDLTDPNLELPTSEVAICLEVAEHIPRPHESTLLDHLLGSCQQLVISWAAPGQPGTGHVNCRREEEVIALFASRGFVVDGTETARLRKSATVPWLKQNVLTLSRDPGQEVHRNGQGSERFAPGVMRL